MKAYASGSAGTRAVDGQTAKLQRELESLCLAVAKAQANDAVQVTLLAAPQLLSATRLA